MTLKFEFNAKNKEIASKILAKYPKVYKKAAIIPLLDLGQRQEGYTSLAVMNHVANVVEVDPMRVYEVASFYTMFNRTPVGKNFIQVCTTTPCALRGSGEILKTIEDNLNIKVGETTEDKKFTIVEVECQGACVNAPMIVINDDFYEDLDSEKVVQILDCLKSGKDVPKKGSYIRLSCEPTHKKTSLTSEVDWKKHMRSDL